MRRDLLICLALALLTCGSFGHAVLNGFVNYDDNDYVTANRQVLKGLSAEGVAWAFTTTRAANWHPLTWLSLQLDATLFGPDAWGFHLTNVVLHALNAVLLYLALRRLTGAAWRAAAVAAFFAVHPLHVESVAWVAERKDVLSGLFWMLTLLAYARYAERPARGRYALVVAAFALGLLAKPMLVTLPCVLLLLDYWPLKRFDLFPGEKPPAPPGGLRRALWEKAPLFALTAAACAVTVYAQRKGGAVSSLQSLPLGPRLVNSVGAYAGYLGKAVWPTRLAAFYPHPRDGADVAAALRAALLLLVFTALALRLRRRRYLAVGWLWFLGTLVPVIGLVQVGSQALADRYTYLPYIGLFVALVWGVADLSARWPRRQVVLPAATLVLLGLCVALTVRQVRLWHNSTWLWEQAIQATRDNWVAHVNLGSAYLDSPRDDRHRLASEQFQRALQLYPEHAKAHNNLGLIALEQGRYDDALERLTCAAELDPALAQVRDNWGVVLQRRGQFPEAITKHREALALNNDLALPHSNLGVALGWSGDWPDAVAELREAVLLMPKSRAFRGNLAWALTHAGAKDEARRTYDGLLTEDEGWAEKARESAWVWAADPTDRRRNGYEAVRRAEQACQALGEKDARALDTLAAAYAEAGRFPEAVAVAREAVAAAGDDKDAIRGRLRGYEEGKPYREEAAKKAAVGH